MNSSSAQVKAELDVWKSKLPLVVGHAVYRTFVNYMYFTHTVFYDMSRKQGRFRVSFPAAHLLLITLLQK